MARALRSDAVRNRQRLLDAAAEAFATAGVGVSLESIAAQAGVSIGTLYNHFPDRDALIDAVVGDSLGRIVAVADDAAGFDDPWAAFEALILGTCELQASDRAVADLLGMRYPHTGTVATVCDHLMLRFVEIIERGRRAGVLRDDLVVDDIGPILWANARIVEAGGTVTPDAWRRHLGFVLDGLRGAARPLD
jgi:AcrR family transcriptional regulator